MTTDKLSQFILRLIKHTKSGELRWTSITLDDDELPNGEFIINKLYSAQFNGRDLQLYKYKYKFYKDQYDYDWIYKIKLELVDTKGNTEYEFEYLNSMSDLYDIVREQSSQVIVFIDDVLGLKLEIIEAKYYTSKYSKDITEKVRDKVVNNRLVLDATNKIDGDPEVGTLKKLKVKYKYAGEILEKEVQENQTIIIP